MAPVGGLVEGPRWACRPGELRNGSDRVDYGPRHQAGLGHIDLPGAMNGRQMADAARQTRPELKVLCITRYALPAGDDSYVIVEVKGDNMIDGPVVLAKKDFAHQVAVANGMPYEVINGSLVEAREFRHLI